MNLNNIKIRILKQTKKYFFYRLCQPCRYKTLQPRQNLLLRQILSKNPPFLLKYIH